MPLYVPLPAAPAAATAAAAAEAGSMTSRPDEYAMQLHKNSLDGTQSSIRPRPRCDAMLRQQQLNAFLLHEPRQQPHAAFVTATSACQ
jgi:hypothetical protein